MAITSQLRTYTINRGEMDVFIKGWKEQILPVRVKYGFRVDAAWVVQGENKFVWVLTYEGDEDWDAKNQAYYDSPERKTIDPDPARHIAHMDVRMLTPVPLT